MSNNLLVSYDLNASGQNYDAVINVIKSLGNWAKIQKSVWYVNSSFNAELAAKKVYASMDNNDSLIVLDASNNDAYWYNLSDEVGLYIQRHWRS